MQCPECASDVPPGARFCPQCAAPQRPTTCPACGEPATSAARFCAACGYALAADATSRAPVAPVAVAERRVCSVLFCDLVGFTPLSESRDPEEVRELLSHYFDVARTVIVRYGGTVEKFIGDAVMAVWGTPTALEGDAERAVRAALDLVVAVGETGRERGVPTLRARAGVVTGEVAVNLGAVGEGMVAGDAVNTAARVQAVAEPGTVLVDEATHRVAAGSIAFIDAGPRELKGKATPVPLWRAERVRSGVGGNRREDGLEAPLLGREAELRLIKELFHACVDRRTPRLVSVTAAAGLGKSRLGWEFEKYIDGLAVVVNWHRGRCLSYGDGVAFWALAEMVRQRFDIAEEDPVDVAARKFEEGLDRYVPDSAERQYVGPRLARLLGIGTDGSFNREDLFAGWRLFFERLAADGPVVMLVEDMQHADPGLLDFLDHLLDWSRDSPIFILTFARPELELVRPGWDSRRSTRTALALEPLDERAMLHLLDALVPGMPEQARAAIATQAQGVPLYAVETVRMLIDRDVVQPVEGRYRLVGDIGQLTVPDTLQSLLAARLDSLDPDARRLIGDAAVLGGTFPHEALVAVSGLPDEVVRRVLDDLVRREVLAVRADPLSPQRGQYGFVQMLFRQVVYDTLSRRERKARHLAVAAHLRSTFADGGEEVSEVIAQHLLDALSAVPGDSDADEVAAEAIEVLIRAAERAVRTGAPATAAQLFLRAADLHDADDAESALASAALRERAGEADFVAANGEASAAAYREAAATYRRYGRERDAARADAGSTRSLTVLGRYSEARRLLDNAVEILSPEPDADTVLALCQLGGLEAFAGAARAEEIIQRGLALAQSLALPASPLVSELLVIRGIHHASMGRLIQAAANLREALRIGRAAHDELTIVRSLLNLGDVLNRNDPAAAAEIAAEAIVQCRRMGARSHLGTAVGNFINANFFAGDWNATVAVVEEALEKDELAADPVFAGCAVTFYGTKGADLTPLSDLVATVENNAVSEDAQAMTVANCALAAISAGRGDARAVLDHAQRAIAQTATLGVSHDGIRLAWPRCAEAAVRQGDLVETARLLELIDSQPIGIVPPDMRADAHRIRALMLAAADDPAAAAAFDTAIDALRKLGYPFHLAVGLIDQAEYLCSHGDVATGRVAASEAADLAARLGALPVLERARAIAPIDVRLSPSS